MRTIEYKVSYENMISRIPGLFAYLDSDEFGNLSLHKATDSIDGCYSKIIENIQLPEHCTCYNPLYQQRFSITCFVNTNNVFDIITRYEYDMFETDEEREKYEYSDSIKILTPQEYDDLENLDEKSYYDEVYVNINNSDDIISKNTYESMLLTEGETYTFRTIISYYYSYKDYLSEDNAFKNFVERGIGKIKTDPTFLKYELVPEYIYLANIRSFYNQMVKIHKQCEFYHKLLAKGEDDKYLCCQCEKYEKMGGDSFMEYLKTLIPKADEIAEEYFSYASNASKSLDLEFSIDLLSSYDDMGIMTPYAPQWLPYKEYNVGNKVVYDGVLYICTGKTTGKWDDEYQTVVFDNYNFKEFYGSFILFNTDYDTIPYTTKQIENEGEEWYDGSATRQVSNLYDIGKTVNDYNILHTNEEIEDLSIYQITGQTDSKLKDLRRFATYIDVDGQSPRPQEGFDWLFYYRTNSILNIRTTNDEFGNILDLNTGQPAQEGENLAAYGDFIENITADNVNHQITFVYHLDAHLKTDVVPEIKKDDDGNNLYYWKGFEWDGNERIGIKYEETYSYEIGSDIEKLVNEEFKYIDFTDGQEKTIKFDNYIKGDYDIALKYYKFEFITYPNSETFTKVIANQEVTFSEIQSNFELNRQDYSEFTETELFREDYLNGITYNPTRDIDVKIQRGSTSVFDKHICLSEIKTLEDLENYKNGAFFSVNNQ